MRKVPKLRFKEFSDEWEEKKFKNFLIEKKEITNEDLDLYSLTIENGIIPKNEKYEREFLVNNKDEAYKKMGKNDFAYNPMNIRFGAVAKFDENKFIKISKYYNIFYCNSKVNSYFFEKYIKIKRMIDFYNKISIGSLNEKKRLHYSEFIEIEQPFPSLQEQEKIANFLTNIDKKISLTEEKLELFREYKKGVMQKIFSQELRFKDSDDNDYPEWEEKKLEEVAECLDNLRKPLNSNEREKIKGSIPYYGANGIQGYINNYIFNEELVLLAEDGGNFDDYLTKPIAQYVQGKSWINNHAHVLKGKKVLKTKFLYFSLVHKDIRSFINGTSRSKLNKSSMLNIIILLPALEEQEKIADFLSSIDSKIENIEKELEGLKEFKKGLLQQMFV